MDIGTVVLDWLSAAILVSGPLPLCLAVVLAAEQVRRETTAHNWLTVLTLWSGIETGAVLLAGSLHSYDLGTMLGVEAALAIAGLAALRRIDALRAAASGLRLRGQLSKVEKLVVGSITAAAIVITARTLLRPVIDFDSLWYHLPHVANWYQTASLESIDPDGNLLHDKVLYYPYDWEALSSLLVLPLGEDFLVGLAQVLAWGIWGAAVYATSRQIGVDRIYSLCAAALTISTPSVVLELNTLRIDVALAAFFAATVYFMLAYASTRAPTDAALALLSLALLCGIKMSGLVYAVGLTIWFVVLLVARHGPHAALLHVPATGTRALLLFSALLSLLVGSFWYARNAATVGNPLGYVDLSLVGIPGPLRAEEVARYTLRRMFDVGDPSHWHLLAVQVFGRLQVPFALVCLQALCLPRALLAPRTVNRRHATLIVLLNAFAAWAYWNTPYGGGVEVSDQLNPTVGQAMRYAFPALGTLSILAAIAASERRIWPGLAASATMFGGVTGVLGAMVSESVKLSTFVGVTEGFAGAILGDLLRAPARAAQSIVAALAYDLGEFVSAVVVYLILFALLAHAVWRPDGLVNRLAGRLATIRGAALAAVVALALVPVAMYERDENRREWYRGVYDCLEENTRSGDEVAYVTGMQRYLLYGKRLDRKVRYYLLEEAEAAVLEAARTQKGPKMLAIGPRGAPEAEEARFIHAMEDKYVQVCGAGPTNTLTLYRLGPPSSERP